MRARALPSIAAAVLTLAACSGEGITGLDQAVYNATYAGSATFQNPVSTANLPGIAPPFRISMTLSQLGQSFTGTFIITDSTSQRIYAGSVTGKTDNTGAAITFVVPAPCPGVLYGAFTVADSELTGSASGRDCNSTGSGNDVRITFSNLVRQ